MTRLALLRQRHGSVIRWSGWMLLAGVLALGAYRQTLHWQVGHERSATDARLAPLSAALRTVLARHEALPRVLALDARLALALQRPAQPLALETANRYLGEVQRLSDAEAVYLMDSSGLTVASSNAGGPDSFVGHNYGYRPYVVDALGAGSGRFYGIGATTGRPGYFLASALKEGDRTLGVVAVKVSLAAFERTLAEGAGPTLVANEHGVVILASDPQLRYRSLRPLTPDQRDSIRRARQFEGQTLDALPDAAAGLAGGLVRRAESDNRWELVGFAATPHASSVAAIAAAAAFLACSGLALLTRVVALRRARRRDLLEREDEIRRRIDAGTRHLRQQIEEQARTESMLRATTDSAVQAGKLAVLGQMAAAVSHELNQPLTAMQTFADNGLLLLEQRRLDAVAGNLRKIGTLADRMGQIVGHLRTHARKQAGPMLAVDVGEAIELAMQLLRSARKQDTRIEVTIEPKGLTVTAQPVRLEQVLLNLLRNAVDAVPCTQPPEVRAHADHGGVVIEVLDRGPGIAADAMPHLFEPFFTTRRSGEGLGLGLAVSKMIVDELGGELSAGPREGGGAAFRIQLPRVPPSQVPAA